MSIEIRRAQSAEDIDQCFALRVEVFVGEQGFPQDTELDQHDPGADHFMAVDLTTGRVIGTARLLKEAESIGRIGRLAISQDMREQGYGRDLMWYVMGWGFRKYSELHVNAQLGVIPFYQKLGFETTGQIFIEEGMPHQLMVQYR